jgi:hypothetical protein
MQRSMRQRLNSRRVVVVGKLFATHRQLTGMPYLHHGYVYEGNRAIWSCTHHHGERGRPGAVTAQACAERALRRLVKRRAAKDVSP